MKKAFLVSLLLVLGCVMSSQAVIITWSTDGYDGLSGVTEAVLVYVSSGSAPVYTTDFAITTGQEVGAHVAGLAITPAGVGEQSSELTPNPTQGAYYIVLFNDNNQYAYSSALAYNDTLWDALTYDVMAPASGSFDANSFTTWITVPEPGSALLLAVGAAVVALRRRKKA